MRFLFICLLVHAMCSCAFTQEYGPHKDKSLAYFQPSGWQNEAHLIAGVWADGTVIWSKPRKKGGPQYFKAKVDPKMLNAALKRLKKIGVFDVPNLRQGIVGPDAPHTTLLVKLGDQELRMESWHENFEANGKSFGGDHGIGGLENQTLLEKLSEQSSKYLLYRVAWLEIKLAIANLIPRRGEEITGVFRIRNGKMEWTTNPDE